MPPKKTRKRGARNPTNQPDNTQPSSRQAPPRGNPRNSVNKQLHAVKTSAAGGEDSATNTCNICAEVAKDWAVGQCGHVICGDCSHRMRVLYDRKACVMCNTQLNQVVVVPLRDYRPDMDFETAVALPGAFQDKQVGMWFVDRTRHQQLKNVRGWKCSHRQCNMKGAQESVFANSTQLRAHARAEHRAIYCEICITGNKCFVSELQLYNLDSGRNYSSRLRGHLRKEHPQCRFCREYYLDDDKLYAHLQEAHETCSICERSGRMHEYYVNYEQLENHYRKEHYVCRDEGCRGVVFATQIELQTHEHTSHGDASRGNRSRALRVNLQQLYGDRDAHRRDIDSPRVVRIEQERQAARRQAFLSSNVVFSGALNFEDAPPSSSASAEAPRAGNRSITSGQARGSSSNTATANTSSNSAADVRRPDDGHFHPLELPRDDQELQSRNKLLVRTMRSLLDPAAYEQFRMSSGHFHSGKITAEQYYDAVTDAFGVRAAVRDILPELVALLPTPLLREPLLRICLQRTDTKLNGIGPIGDSGSGAGSSSQAGNQEEQFPSLNGNAAPVRAPQPMRRFGAPGPEDFPRLNRVNKPKGDSAAASSSREASGRSSSSTAASIAAPQQKPSSSSASSRAPPQRTAASVLKDTPVSQRALAQQRTSAAGKRPASSSGTQLAANSFPALAPTSTPSAAPSPFPSLSETRSASSGRGNGTSDAPDPDVSMRVGAVWGGAGNRGRRRGPGRSRRPASPPKSMQEGPTGFPDLRPRSDGDEGSSASEARNPNGSRKQSKVIDVMEIAKSRRNAVQRSNLPKVGGSGYGFAWERKKAQQKRKQIKNDMEQANANKMIARPSSSVGAEVGTVSSTTTNLGSSSTDANDVTQNVSSSAVTEDSEEWTAQDTETPGSSGDRESADFDPYSYLKGNVSQDDPVSSFLGNSG